KAREDAVEPRHREGVRQAGSRRRDAGVAAGDGRCAELAGGIRGEARARQPAVGPSVGRAGERQAVITRLALYLILAVMVARAFWRLFDGIIEGASGGRRTSGVPDRGVQMARDPVCGTFVVADRAVALVDGRTRVYFCSDACRDKYR